MAKCPVCETNSSQHWLRGFVIGLFLALLIGFVAGQLFHSWQFKALLGGKIENLESRNDELKKGYIPPRGK